MLATALVDPVHDGAHHLRMSHCHLLLFAWNLSLGPGEASYDYNIFALVTEATITNWTQSQTQPQTDRAKEAIMYDILSYLSCLIIKTNQFPLHLVLLNLDIVRLCK
jgi:hypothetical protein